MSRLIPERTLVVLVDVQERLAAAMPPEQLAAVVRSYRVLLTGARLLGAPVLATEQYPRGLGPTLPEVAAELASLSVTPLEKLDFSACDVPAFREAVARHAAQAAVVVGMEAHVCVYQTARDLLELGLSVHVPLDGVASRRDDHRQAGLQLAEREGAVVTTTESVVFDWLKRAGTEPFKELSRLIR